MGDRLAFYLDMARAWLSLQLYAVTYQKTHPGFADMPDDLGDQ